MTRVTNFLTIIFLTLITFVPILAEEVIIRDAEIEDTLTQITQRIFDVAGLRKKDAKLYVIRSDTVNAFTIGNGYIFVTSGLLLKFKNPIHIIAVLSHETGHLAGGHIDSMMHRIRNSSSGFLVSVLAGILGSLMTGSADAMAVSLGYAMTTERLLLRFSREQEQAADMLGAKYLEKMGYDPKVMMETFEAFEHMEMLGGASNIPTYARTHPRSLDRVVALSNRKSKKGLKTVCPPTIAEKYKRVTAKLSAYLGDPSKWQPIAPTDDYPKAIYLHRKGRSAEAIDILKKLIRENPKDVYYKETLAQILCKSGKEKEALEYYKQICSRNANVLIKVDYAKALIQTKQIDSAVKILETAKYEDRLNPEIFRLLANAYGQKNKKGLSFLMLAQERILLKDYRTAHDLLKNCITMMDPKTETSAIKKAKHLKELIERERKM